MSGGHFFVRGKSPLFLGAVRRTVNRNKETSDAAGPPATQDTEPLLLKHPRFVLTVQTGDVPLVE